MLKNVLKEISSSKVFSIPLIAKNLNIPEALVEETVKELSRMKYIIEDIGSPTCETKCSGCSMKSLCNIVPIKTISITDKGKKILENM
jgi:CRISPR/Cas system-associated exonuclease Cas4 (RecB family)